MGYSPRYRIWTSEWPNHESETDSEEAIDREKRRCKERGDYYGYIRDTHTGQKKQFGEWPAEPARTEEGQ